MLTRRTALVGGSALGSLMLPAIALAQGGTSKVERYAPPRLARNVETQVLYRRDDEFTGWPYARGAWDFGDGELLQVFSSVPTDYASEAAISHDPETGLDRSKSKTWFIRSTDYGKSWHEPELNNWRNIAPGTQDAKSLADLEPIDPLDKDVIWGNGAYGGGFAAPDAGTTARISRDRGRTWSPDFPMSLDGLQSLSGIQSFTTRPDGTVLCFLIETSEGGWRRHPLVYALPPGGTEFHFMSMITPLEDPKGAASGNWSENFDTYGSLRFGGHRWFYPRGYLLSDGRILCSLRCQRDPMGVMWTELYETRNGGRTWEFLSRVNDFGAPGSVVELADGRLVCVYGYRLMPSGIRAKVSTDGGRTWGTELIVRDDGGSWDLGYPTAWATDDGRVGTFYYMNKKNDVVDVYGGVRHVCCSLFSID
jgi:hypothetical protein